MTNDNHDNIAFNINVVRYNLIICWNKEIFSMCTAFRFLRTNLHCHLSDFPNKVCRHRFLSHKNSGKKSHIMLLYCRNKELHAGFRRSSKYICCGTSRQLVYQAYLKLISFQNQKGCYNGHLKKSISTSLEPLCSCNIV